MHPSPRRPSKALTGASDLPLWHKSPILIDSLAKPVLRSLEQLCQRVKQVQTDSRGPGAPLESK